MEKDTQIIYHPYLSSRNFQPGGFLPSSKYNILTKETEYDIIKLYNSNNKIELLKQKQDNVSCHYDLEAFNEDNTILNIENKMNVSGTIQNIIHSNNINLLELEIKAGVRK